MRRFLKLFNFSFQQDRIFGLDLLRALAIIFILLGHGSLFLTGRAYQLTQYFLFDGVTIFFVLSGFLIGGIWLKSLEKNTVSVKLFFHFWMRRWFRTLPAYYIVLTVLAIIHLQFVKDITISVLPPFYFFAQNIYSPHPWFFAEAWSLSIEEWFYILLPLMFLPLIIFFRFSVKNSTLIIVFLITVGSIIFRIYRFNELQITNIFEWDDFFRRQVVTRLDSLMYGVFGAYVMHYHSTYWNKYKLYFLFAGIMLHLLARFYFPSFSNNYFYDSVFSFTVISIATLFLLPALSAFHFRKNIITKCIIFISVISYSIYLVNSSVMHLLLAYRNEVQYIFRSDFITEGLLYILFWSLTIIISYLLYVLIEYPVMQLRNHQAIKKIFQGMVS
jgi:peptidoglycan/LPS O-acetylase OafA/YrhL